ncbi:MAG: hypothetical protein V4510_09830 [bacterium]
MSDDTHEEAAEVAAQIPAPEPWCASCGHSPAYHDGVGGRPCRAWDPDRTDGMCSCAFWKAPAAAAQ